MEDVAAFILAGGASTRMGVDKATLPFGGRTLLQVALNLARSVTGEVYVVGSRKPAFDDAVLRENVDVVPDLFLQHGPLGGIHAALSGSSAELNLMLAVDTPFLTPELLRYLLHRAGEGGWAVTVPRVGGRYQPLCAVYRRRFLESATDALQSGRNRIDSLFLPQDTLILEEADLARLSFPAAMFDNLNTREEYERARKLTGDLHGTAEP